MKQQHEITNAKITLIWDNGRKTELGTLSIEYGEKWYQAKGRMKLIFKRLGWEFVRIGFKVMFGGRKWLEETHD